MNLVIFFLLFSFDMSYTLSPTNMFRRSFPMIKTTKSKNFPKSFAFLSPPRTRSFSNADKILSTVQSNITKFENKNLEELQKHRERSKLTANLKFKELMDHDVWDKLSQKGIIKHQIQGDDFEICQEWMRNLDLYHAQYPSFKFTFDPIYWVSTQFSLIGGLTGGGPRPCILCAQVKDIVSSKNPEAYIADLNSLYDHNVKKIKTFLEPFTKYMKP